MVKNNNSRSHFGLKISALYNFSERASGVIIIVSVLFGVWTFGTVHTWSIVTMNSLALFLGLLLLLKLFCKYRYGFNRLSWATVYLQSTKDRNSTVHFLVERMFELFSGIGILILVYMVVHFVNYRAEFDASTLSFTYREYYVSWLPHSYDRRTTGPFILRLTSQGLFFLASLHWLMGLSGRERAIYRSSDKNDSGVASKCRVNLPERLEILFWLIVVNTAAVALVGILQRLGDNSKLLWVYAPVFGNTKSHFGPFAYRGNASTYLNLIWPLAIFLLHWKHRIATLTGKRMRVGGSSDIFLYPIVVLIAICPLVTASRAGFGILLLNSLLVTIYFVFSSARRKVVTLVGMCACLLVVGGAIFLGVGDLRDRLEKMTHDKVAQRGLQRLLLYKNGLEMAREYFVWGSGPGSFGSVYQMYRNPDDAYWSNTRLELWNAWVHSDPLEAAITFGAVGVVLLGTFIGLMLALPLVNLGFSQGFSHLGILYIGLMGFLLHSFVDFPFQVYGLFHIFLILSSATIVISLFVGSNRAVFRITKFKVKD